MYGMLEARVTRRQFNKFAGLAGLNSILKPLIDSGKLLEAAQIPERVRDRFPETCHILLDAGYGGRWIGKLLLDDRMQLYPEIKELWAKPAEDLPYERYRIVLGVPVKIRRGSGFIKEHAELLDRIEREIGVDRNVVAAIAGAESDYGENRGKRHPIGVLVTLIEQYPKKRDFGKKQLLELLRFCKKNGFDPFELRGSYAAALEIAHFIPSSLNKLFIDGNKDGVLDPRNLEDSLYSIANYLKTEGWKLGLPIEKDNPNWKAVFSYNHRDNYVIAIKEISENIDMPFMVRAGLKIHLF